MRARRAFVYVLTACTVVIIAILLASTAFTMDTRGLSQADYITQAEVSIDGSRPESIGLPHMFKGLKPGTPVDLRFRHAVKSHELLFLQTGYSPVKVFENGRMVYDSTLHTRHEHFMLEPGLESHAVKLDGAGCLMDIRIRYEFPVHHGTLRVIPPLVGTSLANLRILTLYNGVGLGLSLFFMVLGVFAGIIGLNSYLRQNNILIYTYLSGFCLAAGCWFFGFNPLSSLILRNSAFLYMLCFIGLFCLIPAQVKLVSSIVEFKDDRWSKPLAIGLWLIILLAAMLQVLGIKPFSTFIYFYQPLIFVVEIGILIALIREIASYDNRWAWMLVVPQAIMTAGVGLELYNYNVSYSALITHCLEAGIFIFIFAILLIAGARIQRMLRQADKARYDQDLMEMQMEQQRRYSQIIQEREEGLRKLRHDLRHHLTAISSYADESNTRLMDYLEELGAQIPPVPMKYCENSTVSAITTHYAHLAHEHGIRLDADLQLPQSCKNIDDVELVGIFANLLENAYQACLRVCADGESGAGQRPAYIRISSTVNHNLLTITMENSCDGQIRMLNDRFISSKRPEYGIGITSITSIAQSHQGDARFKVTKDRFQSFVYLTI